MKSTIGNENMDLPYRAIRKLYAQYAKCESQEYDEKDARWKHFPFVVRHFEGKGVDMKNGNVSDWSKALGVPKQAIHQTIQRICYGYAPQENST